LAGYGDFHGSGNQEILWRNVADGSVASWIMNGFEYSSGWISSAPISEEWQIRATPNVTGNASNSILWSNMVTGEQLLWEWNGTSFASPGVFATIGSHWITQP